TRWLANSGLAVDPPGRAAIGQQAAPTPRCSPLLCLIFEKCELAPVHRAEIGAASRQQAVTSQSFEQDIAEFAQRELENSDKSIYSAATRILTRCMIQAVQVLRFHLLEIEKVHELCDNFCSRLHLLPEGQDAMDLVVEEGAGGGQRDEHQHHARELVQQSAAAPTGAASSIDCLTTSAEQACLSPSSTQPSGALSSCRLCRRRHRRPPPPPPPPPAPLPPTM
uniref:Meis_PKNOX_N domain-containing protein n=1 Tax=Macrostomum lignano TaxID=282301 RepID=A0A1I8FPP4_9PLAT